MPNCKCCGKPVTGGVVLHKECFVVIQGARVGDGVSVPAVAIDEDFETMLICAERYACGRQTYMPSLVINYITPHIPYLSDNTLLILDRDLNEAERMKNFGDPKIDEPKWKEFHYWIRQELLRRGRDANRSWRDNNV